MLAENLFKPTIVSLKLSILQTQKKESLSNKYVFVSSTEIIDTLKSEGWSLTDAKETKTRNLERQGFQKHFLSFRPEKSELQLKGDSELRLLVVNSHDGLTGLQFHLGIFRLVCSNGLVVGQSLFDSVSLRHSRINKEEILEAQYRVVANAEKVNGSIEAMRQKILSPAQVKDMANEALELRMKVFNYGLTPELKVLAVSNVQNLLETRRVEDQGSSAWQVYNTLQENMIRGGIKLTNRKTREVKNIKVNMAINKGLFDIAYKYSKAA